MNGFSRFSTLWQNLGVASDAQPVFQRLTQAYAEPQRAYHTLEHIRDCLGQFDGAAGLAERPLEVEAAVWLHDVVYDTHSSNNEERSADWAGTALTNGGVPEAVVERVRELILATKHQGIPQDNDTRLLVDIDLSILGREVAAFERYEQQIRLEYSLVPEAAFRAGRAKILETFLGREFIYQSLLFRERYETPARENLARSIARLRGGR